MNLLQMTNDLKEIENNLENPEAILPIIQQKVDGCVMYNETLDAQIEMIKKKIDELKSFKAALERKQDKFNSYLLMCMDNLGTRHLDGEIYTLKARKPSMKVEIEDQGLIPNAFKAIKTEEVIDKVGIKEAISQGLHIEGARLVEGARSVYAKSKL